MNALGLATKGKICPAYVSYPGGGGIVYRDKYRKPTKKECESLYFPKVYMELIKMANEGGVYELIHLPRININLVEIMKEQEIKFFVNVKFDKIVE